MVDIAIRDGMKAEMHYKDIYQLAKERASHVVKAIGAIPNQPTEKPYLMTLPAQMPSLLPEQTPEFI